MYNFDAKKVKDEVLQCIKNWFDINGKDCKAVLGVSGGKDSSIVASLLVEALGKERVVGVLMPNGLQKDIGDAYDLCDLLDIERYVVPINGAVDSIIDNIEYSIPTTEQAKINLPARLRLNVLYAVSQSINGRVIATGNFSEYMIGWFSRWDCSVGDFAPINCLTATEVIAVGRLILPNRFVDKVPNDGMCGYSDEQSFGFTYAVLDKYLRENICEDKDIKEKIDGMIKKSEFKRLTVPSYLPKLQTNT